MPNSFSETFTNAANQGGLYTVLVNARRRIPAAGIVYRPDLVVTANHVVERDDDITVVFSVGKSVSAKVAGRDPARDLALLRLSEALGSPAPAAGYTPQVGLPVLALGRPETDSFEASFGIISSIGGPVRTGRGGMLEKYLRAETNPYPGFSGGPLIDLDGNLLGLNTSGFSMGFLITIPVDVVWRAAADLAEHGSVRRGFLGIRSQPVSLDSVSQAALNRSQVSGLLLVGIEPDSPASQAGLIVGDILVSIEGSAVTNPEDLQVHLDSKSVGQTISVKVLRGGQRHDVTVTVGERK
jgi:S1-C subfamily serine protease